MGGQLTAGTIVSSLGYTSSEYPTIGRVHDQGAMEANSIQNGMADALHEFRQAFCKLKAYKVHFESQIRDEASWLNLSAPVPTY